MYLRLFFQMLQLSPTLEKYFSSQICKNIHFFMFPYEKPLHTSPSSCYRLNWLFSRSFAYSQSWVFRLPCSCVYSPVSGILDLFLSGFIPQIFQPSSKTLLLRLWVPDQQHQHHLGVWQKCRGSGLSCNTLNDNLQFNKILR